MLLNTPLSMSRWKVTFVPLVPSMVLQLVNTPEWEKTDTSTVETVTCGSALLPPELNAKIASKVKRTVTQGYGLSECVRVPPFASVTPKGFTSWRILAVHRGRRNVARKLHPWI